MTITKTHHYSTPRRIAKWFALPVLLLVRPAFAQEKAPANAVPDPRPAHAYGHSALGGAFDDIAREKAYLMRGMPKIVFPITTTSREAQRFFEQGVGQLHGYWYLEAQRSFRKVVALDPQCAMGYWGIAMTRFGNDSLVKDTLTLAMRHLNRVSAREKVWLQSVYDFHTADSKMPDREKTRKANYLRELHSLVDQYPDDIEAKAFLAHALLDWRNAEPNQTRETTDALMKQVLAVNPSHPIHHYRIHLWDSSVEDRKKALDSAGLCGLSGVGIAHLWHMQGHIFSGIRQYREAVFAQEAAVRVDNHYLMTDKLIPDQIHNYAHNSQWLTENLGYIGRVHDAIELAKNMIELPRHPRYNNVESFSGSAYYGHLRLIETLYNHELWQEVATLNAQGYLEEGKTPAQKAERLQLLAIASFGMENTTAGQQYLNELEALREAKPDNAELAKSIAEVRGYKALYAKDTAEAKKQFASAKSMPKCRSARVNLALGEMVEAEKLAREAMSQDDNQVERFATLIEVLYRVGKRDEAKTYFQKLRKAASDADIEAPLLVKLAPIAKEFGYPTDWRIKAADTAEHQQLMARLGSFRWEPSTAPNITLQDSNLRKVNLSDYRKQGKPLVVVFYLGNGCEHCMTQLSAFAPLAAEFEKAGISLVAVNSEGQQGMPNITPSLGAKPVFPFPTLADASKRSFKAFRAYDDFEKTPLHGLFLIDGAGKVRWQEIRFEPFQDVKFLLTEAKRLLARPAPLAENAQKQGQTEQSL